MAGFVAATGLAVAVLSWFGVRRGHLWAATAHLRAHPEDGRVADRAATVVLEQGCAAGRPTPWGAPW